MGNHKTLHYVFAGLSFLVSFLVYYVTMQPTVPFWDCGEFASAAWAMQVPHPPGSPLWTLLGRFAMMLPTQVDLVARYNLFSVLASSATILLLYLTVARLIKLWRGSPKSISDVITHCGGAFIAAACYTFTDSFWFNAVESEVYAFGSFFIALVPWLMLVWYDHADEDHSEKYLLLVSYIIGLSMGVHQLAILTIFPCFMLIYYRRRDKVDAISWVGMVGASVIAFFISYKVILSWIVEWLGTMPIISIAIFAATIAGIVYSQKNRKPILNISLWAGLLMFLGYSTYTLVLIRANQEPPLNMNAPATFEQFTRYINREQYGSRGFFPRRWVDELGQQSGPTWDLSKYASDGDFFWKYQTDHMYNRYLYWNFIGRASDKQDDGTDWSKTWGIPFLVGLFGLFWHFRRDPRRALSMLAMFILLGWMTVWYQNQQDPQPRERDYFYVGAFYVYAMWVGIGATGLMELLRKKKKAEDEDVSKQLASNDDEDGGRTGILAGAFALALLAIPINMCVGLAGMATGKTFEESSKWQMYSREGNYIPFDYAYNILQSTEKDAILFTFGDNDTFPLWCLQDVYGIRRDVRIVQLSLSNIGWYINQLKNQEPWGAKKIALATFSDESLRVPETDPKSPKFDQGEARPTSIQISGETMRSISSGASSGDTTLFWTMKGTYGEGSRYIFTVADQLSLDIIRSNINSRPVYYSVTVPDNYRIGLDEHLISEGMALRVTPVKQPRDVTGYGGGLNKERLQAHLLDVPASPSAEPKRGMMIRTYNDPNAHLSYLDKQYSLNYFLLYLKYANYEIEQTNYAEGIRTLDTLDKRLPPELMMTEYYPAEIIADLYNRAGNNDKTMKYAKMALEQTRGRDANSSDPSTALRRQLSLANLYSMSGKFDSAIAIFRDIQKARGETGFGPLEMRITETIARKLEHEGKKQEALAKYNELFMNLGIEENKLPGDYLPLLQRKRNLQKLLGSDDTARK